MDACKYLGDENNLSNISCNPEDDKTPMPNSNLESQTDYPFANLNIFSRFKQSLATSSVGFLVNQNPSFNTNNFSRTASNLTDQRLRGDTVINSTNVASTTGRLSDVKRMFNFSSSVSPLQQNASHMLKPAQSKGSLYSANKASGLSNALSEATLVDSLSGSTVEDTLFQTPTDFDAIYTSSLSSGTLTDTSQSRSSPCAYKERNRKSEPSLCIKSVDEENAAKLASGKTKKGKNPQLPLPYDTLIADISDEKRIIPEEAVDEEESSEWYGLEYTLQLSRRDSRASDHSSSTTGEHSKSRQSWAAIHQGTIEACYEDQEYQNWQKWHRHLDRMDKRRRRERTVDFKHYCERRANFFVDEIYARRALEIYEDNLTDREVQEAVQCIQLATEHYPDPFFPAEKHGLSWVLKSHRSFTSLFELNKKQY